MTISAPEYTAIMYAQDPHVPPTKIEINLPKGGKITVEGAFETYPVPAQFPYLKYATMAPLGLGMLEGIFWIVPNIWLTKK